MKTLRNAFLEFALDPKSCTWNLIPVGGENLPALERARIGVAFREGRRRTMWLLRETQGGPVAASRKERHLGACRTLTVKAEAGSGLAVTVEWRLPREKPFLLWRVFLENTGNRPVFIDWIDVCLTGRRFGVCGGIRLPYPPARRTMIINGWQTWSFAGGLRCSERQPGPKLGPINTPMHIGTIRRPSGKPGHFVSDMFTAIGGEAGQSHLTAGFLAQREQFGAVETYLGEEILPLRMEADTDGVRLDPGRTLRTDPAYLSLSAAAAEYFDAAARENVARTRRAAPAGWGSWYYYYSKVCQDDLEKNTDAAGALQPKLPLQLIQLDDGFQADVGDWFERNEKFPSPMSELSARIRKAGFLPGIWLAPFILRRDSRAARNHPDWVAPGAGGVMSNVTIGAVRQTRSLDVTRPEVLEHVARIIRTAVGEWKFPFLKLDFLYHPAAKGTRYADPTITRAQALRKALEEIRKAAGEKAFLLGCGCPLGSGIGVFDAMRIGPDVDSIWKPHLFHQVWAGLGDPTIPAASNAVRNMIARAPLHRRWWWNDPDCLLARDEKTRLTADERRTLAAAIALSGGMLILSDDLSALSPAAVRLAQVLFPPLHRAAEFPAWRGGKASPIAVLPMIGPQGTWWVIGVFNWGDRSASRFLDVRELTGMRGEATVFSFWDERCLETAGGQLECAGIPPHGSMLLAVRPRVQGARFVGSNLHYSQGAEVAEWKTTRSGLRAVLRLGREADGAVWLALPAEPSSAVLDREPVRPKQIRGGVWKIPVRFTGEGVLDIRWESKRQSGGRRGR